MNWPCDNAVAIRDPKLAARGVPDSVRFWLLFVGCGVACTLVIVRPLLGLGVIGGVIGCYVVVYLLFTILSGKIEPVILAWVLIFPLGYYFLSFPPERSIITLDRMLLPALLLATGLASRGKSKPLPDALRRCAIAWIAFLVVAAASLVYASDVLVSAHLF